jgi:hypothetical protein
LLGVGQHVVTARISTLPDKISWFRGDIEWGVSIADPGASIALSGSNVEVFFLPAVPVIPFTSGVWAEALRFLCGKAGVLGQKTASEVTENITRYCHSSHGLEYDTVRGAPRYGNPQAREFLLKDFMKRAERQCCCYDMASAVQVLAAALGVATEWLYMNPYGFIHTTNLIGVGACNNPFYMGNGSDKIVLPRDRNRTPFGNHAFASLSGKILDACAGPHVGTESEQEYIDSSIDSAEYLYPNPARFRAGAVADINIIPPVTIIR